MKPPYPLYYFLPEDVPPSNPSVNLLIYESYSKLLARAQGQEF